MFKNNKYKELEKKYDLAIKRVWKLESQRDKVNELNAELLRKNEQLEKKWKEYEETINSFENTYFRYKLLDVKKGKDGIYVIKTFNMRTNQVKNFKLMEGHSKYEQQLRFTTNKYIDRYLIEDKLI